MDGLDVALCLLRGNGADTHVTLEHFDTVPFLEETKAEVRQIFAKKQIDFQHLTLLNAWIGRLHGQMVLQCLEKWGVLPADVDVVASHGQTVFHAPKILHQLEKYPNATLQIGDGDHVATTTGIITLSDFRQKHVAAGGEGAPLAVYGDYFVFSKKDQNRIMLNMGGIANFTYLPGNLNANEVFVTDTGPGNTLIDAAARQFFGHAYDESGRLAAGGIVNLLLLKSLKEDAFFKGPVPKTTGPELFNLAYLQRAQQRSNTAAISPHDLVATLTRFSAETIAEAILRACRAGVLYHVYLSGGGAHNPVLVGHLRALLPHFNFRTTDELGISGDAKEAVLFAILANEALVGGQTSFGNRQGVPTVSMGKISFAG